MNGERIECSEIEREADRLRPQYEKTFADMETEEREAQLLDWSKENIIERLLINQDAKENGAKVSAEEIESVFTNLKQQYEDPEQFYKDFGETDDGKIKQELQTHLRVEKRLEEMCADITAPSDESVEEYYEQHKQEFETGEQVRAAHIVKYVNWQNDEQTAHESISKAHAELAGGASFEVVVDKYTDCADSGGDLGYVNRGQMVEEFEDVVFNLGPGQLSGVFRTRFGFHIAKVYDRKPPSIPPLKEVRANIVEQLSSQIREEAINKFIDTLKEKATIEEV